MWQFNDFLHNNYISITLNASMLNFNSSFQKEGCEKINEMFIVGLIRKKI